MNTVTKEEWENEIKNNFSSINGMAAEIDFMTYVKKDLYRQNKNKALVNLREKARPYVFPCHCKTKAVNEDSVNIGEPDSRGSTNSQNDLQKAIERQE